MNALLSFRRLGLAGLLIACLASGCKSGPKTASVSGAVTVDGAPLTSGQVSFHALDKIDTSGNTGATGGTIDASGKYTLLTGSEKGVPLGKYKVTVNPSMVPSAGGAPPAAFNTKFQNVKTTTIELEVVSSPAPGAYDLKLTKN